MVWCYSTIKCFVVLHSKSRNSWCDPSSAFGFARSSTQVLSFAKLSLPTSLQAWPPPWFVSVTKVVEIYIICKLLWNRMFFTTILCWSKGWKFDDKGCFFHCKSVENLLLLGCTVSKKTVRMFVNIQGLLNKSRTIKVTDLKFSE